MFEQAFRNIDDVLRKEAGCTTELDYTEQTSWLLFLKYLDGLDQDKADEAKLDGKRYTFLLDKPYRWETWAAPKDPSTGSGQAKLDHNKAMGGDDLRDFVNDTLFPYWDDTADVFRVTKPVVIFGDHTKVLKFVDFDFVLGADGVKILPPKSFLNPKFFFYSLRSVPLKSLGYSRHYRLLKELQIGYPDMNKQTEITERLDALDIETQRLAAIYERKLAALEALKKSLLHQALTGQL